MNQQKSYSRYLPWVIWSLGALLFFSEYAARVAPSVMTKKLQLVFNANAVEIGLLGAFFYYAYVAMQIPVGVLVDRFGAHKLLTVTTLICVIGTVIFALSHNLYTACFARLLIGFGASFAFIGTLKLASVWFPASRLGLLVGMTQSMGMLGAAMGQAPIAFTVSHFGWRGTTLILSGVFLVLALLIGFIVRNHPPGYVVAKPSSKTRTSIWNALAIVLKSRQAWINGLFVGCLYGPTAAFAELWGPRFLHQVYGLNKIHAGFAVSLIYIGWLFGGPLSGWLSDRIGRRKPLMLFSAACCTLLLTAVVYLPHMPLLALEILLFAYGVANFGVATSYTFSSEINPHRIAGTSMAFANMASVAIGSWIFMPLIGWLVDHFSKHTLTHQIIYTAHSFRIAFAMLPVCALIALISGLFLKETYCKNNTSNA